MSAKRLFGLIFSFMLVFAVVFVAAENAQAAEAAHSHPACGSVCSCVAETHSSTTWQAWDGTGILYSNRYYYLTRDVVLDYYSSSYGAKIYLCLNGYSITCEDVISDPYTTLQLVDCTGTGKVTGVWGDNAAWVVQNGTLTISGTGELESAFSGNFYPWGAFRSGYETVVVEPGITGIPEYAFEYCENLKTVCLPETLTYLNLHAFQDCESLNHLLLPGSLTSVEGYSPTHDNNFSLLRCEGLTDLYYSGTLEQWQTLLDGGSVDSYDSEMKLHFLQLYEQAPTCTADGLQPHYRFDDTSVHSQIYDADRQPIEKAQTIPQLGHGYISHPAQAPTCEAVGWNAYNTCTRCEYTSYKEIPMLAHEYEAVFFWSADYSSCEVALFCQCGLQAELEGTVAADQTDPSRTVYTAMVAYDGQEFTDVCTCRHYTVGDVNGSDSVDVDDAICLLMHVLLPESFPLNQNGDFDKDGMTDEDDAIYLLQHVLLPDLFPIE